MPVVLPRQPPPLYTWEVAQGLYPFFPLPRRPRFKPAQVAAFGLVSIAVIAFALAGVLAYYGWEATAPGSYTISGNLATNSSVGQGSLGGIVVDLTGEGGYHASQATNRFGQFSFSAVPSGGVTLRVNDPLYANTSLVTFVSTVYNAGSTGLVLPLAPAASGNATERLLTPFPDMEAFLATVGGGAVVLVFAGALAAGAAAVVRRPSGAVVGVLGAGAGVGVPVALLLLSLGTPFPYLALGSSVAGAAGAFVLVVEAATLSRTGPMGAPR